MADLEFPWQAFLQAAQQRNRNRLVGPEAIGQGLQTLGQVGGAGLQARAQKMKEQKLLESLKGIPQFSQFAGAMSQRPELIGQLGPELMKPQKQPMEWSPVSGMISKSGKPIEIDKTTGQMRTVDIPGGARATSYGATMAPIRQGQYTMQDLPSNQGPNTAGGAAYQVKVASRQGKSLIAKATTPQAISLASADLGRAVQRSAPLAETIGASNFANNLTTKWNLLTQKLTSDPSSADIPKIRREIYNMFDELDRAATPFIQNQLDDMADNGFPVNANTRSRQLGQTLPDIPFIDVSNSQTTVGTKPFDTAKEQRYQEWKKANGY